MRPGTLFSWVQHVIFATRQVQQRYAWRDFGWEHHRPAPVGMVADYCRQPIIGSAAETGAVPLLLSEGRCDVSRVGASPVRPSGKLVAEPPLGSSRRRRQSRIGQRVYRRAIDNSGSTPTKKTVVAELNIIPPREMLFPRPFRALRPASSRSISRSFCRNRRSIGVG
jgi:hypothetical protein